MISRLHAAASGRLHARARAALALLPAFLTALALAPAAAQAKVYFTAFLGEGGTGIDRAAFDGSALETLQFQPIGFEDGLALDVAAGRMYWTDTDASTLWSSNLNGSEAHLLLIDPSSEPLGIALDLAAGKLYWTDREGIKRASLEGAEAELLVKGQARGFIALDPAAGRMYWADLPTGTIRSAAMAVEPVVSELLVKQASPLGVAVDPVHGRLYWMNIDLKGAKREANLISSARLDGSEAQPLIERGGGEGAAVGGFEGGLAVDPEAGKLYWGEAVAQRIATSNLDGSEAHTLFSTAPDTPEALALDASGPHPTATSPPVIEGSPQVGAPLQCNPGEWSGTGPISLSYQWQLGGFGVVDGSSWFVAPSEAAGEQLRCIVTARDSVDEGVASSAPVSINALPAEAPSGQAAPRLLGGIALAHMTSSGTSARVPVFSTLAANATLTATRVRRAGAHGRRQPVAHARARAPVRAARVPARARGRSRLFPRTVSATRALAPGRSAIVLRRLLPGARYALTLSLRSTDGQTQHASAVLDVAARSR